MAAPSLDNPQWAASRETYGIMLASTNPIAKLISAQPELRSLTPAQLGARLRIPTADARTGIQTLGRETFGSPPAGTSSEASFDDLTLIAGRYAAPVDLIAGPGRKLATKPTAPECNAFAAVLKKGI
jgi:hypothetical protein